jgi:hypothetical protein
VVLQKTSKHPQCKHIEQQMLKTTMHEHVGEELVWLKKNRMHIMQRKKIFDNVWIIVPKCYLRYKNQHIYNEQVFYYGRESVRTVILQITHYAKIAVMALHDAGNKNYNF